MNIESSGLRRRARIHAALSDPARLAMIDALCLGDASPGEIAGRLGLPSNLVAHHLKVLEGAELVRRTRSEGDRRRTYLRLRPQTLAALVPAPMVRVDRVVFVCTHNSARSQLAAALLAHRGRVPATSAGTRPAARVHPRTVAVAHQHGLRLDPGRTAHVDRVITSQDLVIAVCDNAHEELADSVRPALHWSVPDPVRVGTAAAFEAAFTDLAERVDRLVRALNPGGHRD